ncbi:hypothetical protein D3Y59_12715 [Hymenobacter oligotrophus]|uniref:Tyrosine specific protein phosphatases domain-containing protein n=1 Tax=Hymenobacter oligotrophus TaxID=2319843 RepID=A0A3B7RAR2_9BACT|nr:ADP-ribosylglycohydrolase family protein [Hymenobacter oligotrophus]AYA37829.1 hypothetical protein D3Y59_12715 [Hymenobacter oligotrophus]
MNAAFLPPYSPLESTCRAALLGVAVGDALGVPVEFQNREMRRADPVVSMRGYGTHHQPMGTWSDDTSLTLCLAEALASGYSALRLALNVQRWYREAWWTAHQQVFDIGITTREALHRLERGSDPVNAGGKDEWSNGNGALMRILPLVFYQAEAPIAERFQRIQEVSALTHGHIRSAVACWLYLEMARALQAGLAPPAAYAQLCQQAPSQLQQLRIPASEMALFERVLSGRLYDLAEADISSSGYVLHTLEAALWCLLHHETFAETVLAAVNLGDDTDTTGAVAGGLAGMCYGETGIPSEWLAVVARRADIENLASRLAHSCATAAPETYPAKPLPNSYWATPTVLACEYPGDRNVETARNKLARLLNAGITDFFDLTEAGELIPYESLLQEVATAHGQEIYYHRFPIKDADVPSSAILESVLAELAMSVAAGRKAAVHCWGGVGRTGTVVGCYLVRQQKLSGPAALALIARQWQGVEKSHRIPRSPETAAQWRLVESFK